MGPVVAGDLISLGLQGGQEKKAAWGQPLPGEPWGPSGLHWLVQWVCLSAYGGGGGGSESLLVIVCLVLERMAHLLFPHSLTTLQVLNHRSCHHLASLSQPPCEMGGLAEAISQMQTLRLRVVQ